YPYNPSEAIYSTSTKDLSDSPFSIDRTFVYFPEHVFPYIQAQSGVFTVHHRRQDGTFVPFVEETRGALFTKILIPTEYFFPLRNQLHKLGVHSASLFPGLSGL